MKQELIKVNVQRSEIKQNFKKYKDRHDRVLYGRSQHSKI